jgi:hypothetical protein
VLNVDKLPEYFIGYRARFRDRDDRMLAIRAAVNGDKLSTAPDDTDHGSVSPNLPQVALEDTAESAALMPTIRVHPMEPTSEAKAKAARMERIAASYLNRAGGQLFLTQAFLHLAAYGFFIPNAYMDAETGLPTAQLRDAVGAYPEADWKPGMTNRRCIFARDVYVTQLPVEYQAKLSQFESNNKSIIVGAQKKITLLEYFDEQETVIAAMYAKSIGGGISTTHVEYLPAELERFEHGYDLCPVVVGQRLTLDGEPRGQFDQVLAAMQAHDRLMAMAIDYADQAVYSDIWVVDALGEIPYGGGAIIQLGPNGKIGRVPPAVPSLSLFNELDQLLDTIHLGGRWPKSRPGEIDQAIASAKFLETSVGVMNTVLKTYHLIMKYTLEQLLNIMFKMDQKHGRDRQVAIGVLRNQQFVEAYNPREDIDLSYRVEVEYGLGLGRDPAQSAVLQIQYMQVGAVSKEFVQESIEGINDVDRERRRIDVEKFTDMMFGKIMQGVQGGTIPDKALVDMAKARMTGEGVFEIYEKYVLKPQEDAQSTGITSGLDGSLQQPGAAPGAAGPAGLAPPPPPDMPKAMGRLSIPMGGGSFAGTQSGG